ncbi:hypothetical protein AAD001_10875 [Colwelliaceae bacterium 6471]
MQQQKKPLVQLLFILSILFLGFGCKETKTELSEQQVTVAFFDAIYNEKDLNKAIALSTENFKNEMKKYQTARNFARRLLNLYFDSVQIDAQKFDTQVIDEFNSKTTMTVLFTGERNGRLHKDIKKIILLKKGDAWLVDQVLDN